MRSTCVFSRTLLGYYMCVCVCVCVCVCPVTQSCLTLQSHGLLSHQASLSMGFPRQEHWSELSFPTPGNLPNPGIEPMALVSPALAGRFFTTAPPGKMLVTQSCPTLCDPMGCSPPSSSVHGILQARLLEWLSFSSKGALPNSGIKPRSPTFQADSLQSEPPEKPQKCRHTSVLFHGRVWFIYSTKEQWPSLVDFCYICH